MREEEKLHDLQMKSYDAYLNIGTTIRKDAVVLKLVPLIGGNQACQYSHEHHGQELLLGCHLFDFFAAAQGRTILASNLIYFIYTRISSTAGPVEAIVAPITNRAVPSVHAEFDARPSKTPRKQCRSTLIRRESEEKSHTHQH